jgi:branched-chain amino acid transport system substrate-binding protein
VSDNPDGLVAIIGHDLFCIPTLQGLTAAGFEGTITTIQFCVTDAMREAIPDDVKEGIVIAADGPIDDDTDESWLQYNAVLDEYNAPSSIAREDGSSLAIFSVLGALSVGTQQLEGDATPESVTAAIKAMPNSVLPGSGGRHFKCDGKASTTGPAVCSASVLSAELDAEGFPTNYQVINDAPDENE